jgi:hypothetical protein
MYCTLAGIACHEVNLVGMMNEDDIYLLLYKQGVLKKIPIATS